MDLLEAMDIAVSNGFQLMHYQHQECHPSSIVGFHEPEYNRLIETGRLTGNFWDLDVYNDYPLREGLAVAISVDAQIDLWDDDPPSSIEPFLSHAHLAYYSEKQEPRLELISSRSLFELLPFYINKYIGTMNKMMEQPEDPCKPAVERTIIKALPSESNVSGRVYVCDRPTPGGMICGMPFCYSSFAWIKDGIGLLYMHSGGDIITYLWLFPFVTTARPGRHP